jgi:hypothetical protein
MTYYEPRKVSSDSGIGCVVLARCSGGREATACLGQDTADRLQRDASATAGGRDGAPQCAHFPYNQSYATRGHCEGSRRVKATVPSPDSVRMFRRGADYTSKHLSYLTFGKTLSLPPTVASKICRPELLNCDLASR